MPKKISNKKLEKEEIFNKVVKYHNTVFSDRVTESKLKRIGLALDDKVYMIHLEDCIKEYNSNKGRRLRAYLTVGELVNPKTILHTLFRSTISYYITMQMHKACFFCNIVTEDMSKRILYSALNYPLNKDYAQKVLEEYCKRKGRNDKINLNSEERQFFSCNKDYAMWAVRFFIEESFSFINFLQEKGHPVHVDISYVEKSLNEDWNNIKEGSYLVQVNEDGSSNRLMTRCQYEILEEVKELLSKLLLKKAIRLYTGLGGTGKSYDALTYAKGVSRRWTCVTLSNTVALKLSKDAVDKGFECIPMSITAFNLQKEDKTDCKYYIIDEFSQWSLHELSTFIQILRLVDVRNGELIVLGDTHQIPSFLGRGCLLHSVQQYLEGTPFHIHKDEIVRQQDQTFKDCIMNYVETGDIKAFDKFRIENIEEYCEPENTMFITGSGYNVEKLNLWALAGIAKEISIGYPPLTVEGKRNGKIIYRHGDRFLSSSDFKELNEIKLEILERCIEHNVPIRVISKDTWVIDKEAYGGAEALAMFDFKVLTNDKGKVTEKEESSFHITLDRVGTSMEEISLDIPVGEFFDKFDFGYAITVNRAQGLDWDNVVVHLDFTRRQGCDYNAQNYEAFYVASTRGKRKTAFYIESPKDLTPFKPQLVANHFSIVEEVK